MSTSEDKHVEKRLNFVSAGWNKW